MATCQIAGSIENLVSTNGTRLTPVWVGFHNGDFHAFDGGETASAAPESLAENGSYALRSQDF